MAPDFGGSDITGRYGLHFHMAGNGSRGSVVDGLVIRDTKGHAFVPVAIMRATSNPSNSHRLGAFYLGQGNNVTVTNSVVVGLQREDGASRSGYIWPEDDEATWFFKGNRAHNNETNGIFVWQNNELPHVIENFAAYYNGQSGVEHGAYTNSYVYKNLILLDNARAIHSHALGEPGNDRFTDTQIWSNIKTNGGTLLIDEHARNPERPVRFVDCDLGEVVVRDSGGPEPSEYDFIRCGLEPSDFDLGGAKSNDVFRVQRANGTAYRLTGDGSVTAISAFYFGAVPGSGFFDTAGSPFAAAIAWLADQGITNGCNPPANTMFCPDDPVTRGQMAAFLVRANGYSAVADDFFVDDENSMFERAINRLATAEITSGCNPPRNNRFCPDRFVTRGQMAAFLVRAFDYSGGTGGNPFSDDNGSVFENAIERLRSAGVTLGCNPPANSRFCPDEYVTRGQMAAFLKRALGG
jgi:hypothetical protein